MELFLLLAVAIGAGVWFLPALVRRWKDATNSTGINKKVALPLNNCGVDDLRKTLDENHQEMMGALLPMADLAKAVGGFIDRPLDDRSLNLRGLVRENHELARSTSEIVARLANPEQ